MKKTKINIFNTIQYIIIVILIILIGYFSVQKFILKNKSINFLNYNFYTILSGSMEPTINIKDLVVTHPKEKYKINDIIAFKHDNAVTVHRIVNVEYDNNGTELFTTKGDNNNTIDNDKITSSDIIGSYRFTIPLLGSFILFVSTNPLFVILFLIIIILIYYISKLLINRIRKK